MTAREWGIAEPLADAGTVLLEASAGTGKTYQIAALVTRLVVERGIPIDRILAITFTESATAELRDRVRRRLAGAAEALRGGAAPDDDDLLTRLVTLEDPARPTLLARAERGLADFDLAPISTIHGFSQRSLAELAFESGQDPDLTVAGDGAALVDELAEDELARLHGIPGLDLGAFERLQSAGLALGALRAVARALCGPVRLGVRAPASVDGSLEDAARRLAELAREARDLGARFESALAPGGIVDGFTAKGLVKSPGSYRGWAEDLRGWLLEGAGRAPKGTLKTAVQNLTAEGLVAKKLKAASVEALTGHPFHTLAEELGRFLEHHAEVSRGLAPLVPFARAVRARYERELTRRRMLTFDAMLSRLAERIEAEGGPDSPLATRLRARYDAVLVDEFQDTDRAQWSVLHAAFHGHRPLYLIGDPKQAIYGFRGADVHVYLAAREVADEASRRTLATNFRSDARAVAAMNRLFRAGSGAFEQEGIDYVHVTPRRSDRLSGGGPGLDVRWVDARASGGDKGRPITTKDERLLARLAAAECTRLLGPGGPGLEGDAASDRDPRLTPADLAVLVQTHDQAVLVVRELRARGIPSVAASKETVFQADVAPEIARWLDAVEAAGSDRPARDAAVTSLFGVTAAELAWALSVAERGDEARAEARAAGLDPEALLDWASFTARLHSAATRWPREGFARVFDRELVELGVLERLLGLPDGERRATDLRHLTELLHAEERRRRLSPGALAAWLRAQSEEPGAEREQRLESDALAVRVETIHASKGLEYPIVLLPFSTLGHDSDDEPGPIRLRSEPPAVDLSPEGSPERDAAFQADQAEQRREELRRLYVALTRARHRTVVWFGPIGKAGGRLSATALGRTLLRDVDRPGAAPEELPVFKARGKNAPPDPPEGTAELRSVEQRLDALVERSDGTIAWSAVERPGPIERWEAPLEERPEPRSLPWPTERRSLVGRWLVASYSGLSGRAAVADVDEKLRPGAQEALTTAALTGAEPAAPALDDAPLQVARPAFSPLPDCERLSLGSGTRYGTFVHEALEQTDFVTGSVGEPGLAALAGRHGFGGSGGQAAELERLLPALLDTPLDRVGAPDCLLGLPAGFSLRAIERSDRLDELSFDLRVGGGTAYVRGPAREVVDQARLRDALAAAAATEGAAAWVVAVLAEADAGRALVAEIAGILTGSIDLVFRIRGEDGPRYFLADYKTNRVESSESGHYAAPFLAWKMATAGYPLQSLLYTLALHRHLRVRLGAGYDYDRHMGGALYLFLRGMAGPATPRDPSGRCL
ncbi:MAG: UvrD-helicase domain-containing protein, partial [Deltaproteobacteria bacterium]|nr:UvrD-helicase domain-containing protein [Deltaproteobacteria bacterium]